MLGGGRMHFGDPRTEPPTGLLAHADAALVGSRGALLEAADAARAGAATPTRLWGVFDEDHLAWVADGPHPEIPSIAEMTESAIALLDARFGAWLLVVEGARIDHGGHGNDLRLALAETLAFDDALAAALRWADGRDDVSTFVVSDHETGGLEWRGEMPASAEPTPSGYAAAHPPRRRPPASPMAQPRPLQRRRRAPRHRPLRRAAARRPDGPRPASRRAPRLHQRPTRRATRSARDRGRLRGRSRHPDRGGRRADAPRARRRGRALARRRRARRRLGRRPGRRLALRDRLRARATRGDRVVAA